MSKKYIIMSDERPDINECISLSYRIIPTDSINELLPFERRHADMQCLRINDTFFVLKEAVNLQNKLRALGLKVITTEEDIKADYPRNVLLNAVFIKEKLFCKTDAVANVVKKYCKKHNIKLINVNQGYTKCSTAVFKDYFITADKGIYHSMTENGVEGLLIESGDIDLDGVDYGFIGGCSFFDKNYAFFSGDYFKHKNAEDIITFLCRRQISSGGLSINKLYDIGGFIVI